MDFCQLKKIGGKKKSIVHSCDSTIDFGILKIKTIKFYRAESDVVAISGGCKIDKKKFPNNL